MTEVITQRRVKLAGIIALFTQLSACGAGTDVNDFSVDAPEMGQAAEVETANNSTSAAPVIVAPVAEVPETPIVPVPVLAPTPTIEPVEIAPIEPETPEPEPETEPLPEPEPTPAPPTNVSCNASSDDIQISTLSLINKARAVARSCGDTFFEAALPLTWNSKLATAAQLHSDDMAVHNFFSHTGSDGLSVSQRVDAQQYNWRTVGENIAAGQPTTESVVDAWLKSPGHCKNLMNPKFEEMAVECVVNSGAQYGQYWTNVLGTTF